MTSFRTSDDGVTLPVLMFRHILLRVQSLTAHLVKCSTIYYVLFEPNSNTNPHSLTHIQTDLLPRTDISKPWRSPWSGVPETADNFTPQSGIFPGINRPYQKWIYCLILQFKFLHRNWDPYKNSCNLREGPAVETQQQTRQLQKETFVGQSSVRNGLASPPRNDEDLQLYVIWLWAFPHTL